MATLAEQAQLFCEASVRDWTGKAARMLAATPELAGYSFATAVVLGDAERVRRDIARDPGLVSRSDERWGWTPLHAACASRWHRLDPARADGLETVARLLLDAGADPNGTAGGGQAASSGGWTPLGCAVAGEANQAIVRLLLERGAVPDDRDLCLAGFAGDNHQTLRLLLEHADNVADIAKSALAAPISSGDTEGVRLLLDAGADPTRYTDDADSPAPVIYLEQQPAGLGHRRQRLSAGRQPWCGLGPHRRPADPSRRQHGRHHPDPRRPQAAQRRRRRLPAQPGHRHRATRRPGLNQPHQSVEIGASTRAGALSWTVLRPSPPHSVQKAECSAAILSPRAFVAAGKDQQPVRSWACRSARADDRHTRPTLLGSVTRQACTRLFQAHPARVPPPHPAHQVRNAKRSANLDRVAIS